MPAPAPHARQTGLTLIELMICLAVMAIIASAAMPSMQAIIERQRLVAATNSLVIGLHQARHAAIMHRRTTQLCPSLDGISCIASTFWSHGWVVRQSSPATDAFQTSFAVDTLPSGITVQTSSGRTHVRFQPDGRSAGSNVTFNLCSAGRWHRQIVLNNAGRVRHTAISRSDCRDQGLAASAKAT